MARPNKRLRYQNNLDSNLVVEASKDIYKQLAGNWNSLFFANDHPITLELACGKGEYTVGLAEKFPDRNYIGVDLKGDRIWVGSQQAVAKGLRNVGFIRSRIEMLPEVFAPGEIDELWLTFPDPRLKDREEKHRLTNIYYLNLYRSLLHPDGWFRFKTDNTPLFEYALEVLQQLPTRDMEQTRDLYASELMEDHHGLKTKYEAIWTKKGENIKYLKCRFDA